MQTDAIVLKAPHALAVTQVGLTEPRDGEVVVAVRHSGVSTGTERLLWEGRMPSFPGLGYPLVPGYEAVGEVVEGTAALPAGRRVFVPGASCYEGARGLFGASAALLHLDAARALPVDVPGPEATLLALAATARHALAGPGPLPGLVVGHGTLGRLAARMIVAAGGEPVVLERDPARRGGAVGYAVVAPEEAEGTHERILDVSGDPAVIDAVMPRLARGGEIVLAGFYAAPVSFAFPPAFMREARLRVAAEFTPADLLAARALVEEGALSLSGLVTHTAPAADAPDAYATAFGAPSCLKMVLDWSDA